MLAAPSLAMTEDLDGLWTGGYAISGSQFQSLANLDMAQGYGELKINVGMSINFVNGLRSGRFALPDGQRFELPGEGFAATRYICNYFVKHDGETLQLAINLQTSGPGCDNRATATVAAGDDGAPGLSYRSVHVDMDYPMQLGIGPLPEDQLATLPEGFDVLGVQPGMSIDDARAAIEEQGFVQFQFPNDPTINAADWSQTTLEFVRGDRFGSESYPEFPDRVTLLESTRFDLDPDAPNFVVMVARTRSWRAVDGDGITPDTLMSSIGNKYGRPSNGGFANDYSLYFDKSGQPAERGTTACFNQSPGVDYQTARMPTGRFQLTLKPSAACGSTFLFTSDVKGSLIDAFNIVLYSEPLMIQDVWRRYSGQVAANARSTFEALDGQSGDDNDLDL
jgi:hypothetical protein